MLQFIVEGRTYAARQGFATIHISTRGDHTRQAAGYWVAHTQTFFEDRIQILQVFAGFYVDVMFLLEGTSDLAAKSIHDRGIACNLVEEACQHGRACLRSTDDDEVECGENLGARHDLEVDVVSHERGHKVWSSGLGIQPFIDTFVGILLMLSLTLEDTPGHQLQQEELQGRIVSRSRCERHALDIQEQCPYPSVVLASLETAERSSESQVANYIHGEEIDPIRHIDEIAERAIAWC